MTAVVQCSELVTGYGAGPDVVRDVSFSLAPGEIVGLLGPNGGGKTTLFLALLGELPARAGEVRVAARPAYVPQTDRARLDFPVSALDVVLMGTYARTPWWRRISAEDRARAVAALERVGLADMTGKRFGTLSGGQRQRVLIARALLADAPVMLLDEPLSGVDGVSAARIESLFDELRGEGHALLVATHDVGEARRWDKVLCLHGRQIAFGAPGEVLSPAVLQETYGAELVVLSEGSTAVRVDHHSHSH